MSLIKITPANPLHSMLSDFFNTDSILDRNFLKTEFLPAVNVKDNAKNYEIDVVAPGMKKEDFKITVEKGVLTISAEKENDIEEENKNFTRCEYNYKSFARSFTLPEDANEDALAARYENGVLKLEILKKENALTPKTKTVAVH